MSLPHSRYRIFHFGKVTRSLRHPVGVGLLPIAIALSGCAGVAADTAVASTQSPPTASQMSWKESILRQDASWYSSTQAKQIADTVLQYQSTEGGWPKNLDLTVAAKSADDLARLVEGKANTIDNGATTMPLAFLARVIAATGDQNYRTAFNRGVDYLLAAQYPNGGWPQFFPLRGGYYAHITFNDNAMIDTMEILRNASAGSGDYAFVDGDRRRKSAAAVARGLDVILKTQLRLNGKLAGWCAQYDQKTLAPAWARAYEMPSISGNESVAIVRFLMNIEKPSPAIVAAVDGAVAWFKSAAIPGIRLDKFTNADGLTDLRVVEDTKAPRIWARFYDLEASRPIFMGRDSQVKYKLADIEHERRNGYGYYGTWPERLVSVEYPAWKAKHPS